MLVFLVSLLIIFITILHISFLNCAVYEQVLAFVVVVYNLLIVLLLDTIDCLLLYPALPI